MSRAKLRALPFVILLFPLDCLLASVILIVDLMTLPLRFFRRPQTKDEPANVAAVTIQILNWDGKHLLEECLPSVKVAAGGPHQVVVVDNGSRDGSVEYLQERFPDVRVIRLDRNYGFSLGNNRGFEQVQSDIVVLLNNDMLVAPDFLQPLLAPFSDPSVFAVASQIFFSDPAKRREETGKTKGEFEHGFFRLWHDDVDAEDEGNAERHSASPIFWAGGGSCAVDLRKLKSFGGFDGLYHPFYVEDTDISWQAWKRGWKCLFAPKSHVVHKHRGTSRPKFGDEFVDRTVRRNQYLFVWKNVSEIGMMLQHLVSLPWIHGNAIIQNGARVEIRSYLGALVRLPHALWRRAVSLREYTVSDSDVIRAAR